MDSINVVKFESQKASTSGDTEHCKYDAFDSPLIHPHDKKFKKPAFTINAFTCNSSEVCYVPLSAREYFGGVEYKLSPCFPCGCHCKNE